MCAAGVATAKWMPGYGKAIGVGITGGGGAYTSIKIGQAIKYERQQNRINRGKFAKCINRYRWKWPGNDDAALDWFKDYVE